MKPLLSIITTVLLFPVAVFCQDIKDSKDHPLITRYPGSVINYYEEQKFQPYKIATGPETGYRKIDKWTESSGKFTRIYYVVKGNVTITEVFGNYLSALQNGGFSILAKGLDDKRNVSKEVGGKSWLVTAYVPNPFPPSVGIDLLNGSATSGGTCFVAGMVQKNGGKAYVVIGGSQYKADEKVFLVDIIEETSMEDGLVKVNADAMLSGIKRDGKIALYGIFFDFDKSDIKPGSKEALDEIVKLLTNNPSLKLFIVGHTDMKGELAYNISLSKRRAEAVVKELTGKYGINGARLASDGVGPLCPVSGNETEEGRKLNRRVELVAK